MFASLETLDSPFVMEAIWECNVDSVDRRVFQEGFIRRMYDGNVMLLCVSLRLGLISSSYGSDENIGVSLGWCDDGIWTRFLNEVSDWKDTEKKQQSALPFVLKQNDGVRARTRWWRPQEGPISKLQHS